MGIARSTFFDEPTRAADDTAINENTIACQRAKNHERWKPNRGLTPSEHKSLYKDGLGCKNDVTI